MNRILKFKLALGFVLIALLFIPATISVHAAPAATPALDTYLTNCTGSYYNNLTLSGSPVLTRTDSAVNFVWAEGTSPGAGVNTSNYSVGWSCPITIATEGDYTLTAVTDDGMNVLLDGSLVMWAWYDQGPTTYTKTGHLTAGAHTITIQYYNAVLGGTAQVSINTGSSGGGGGSGSSYPDWKGEYFNNKTLSGSPVLTRNDASINFNWGQGSPDGAIVTDNFSVRWTRTINFTAGNWKFTSTTDDGVRVWVDGNLIIDHWVDQASTTWSNTVNLGAGNHTVKMEYYDATWYAVAKLTYELSSGGGGGGQAWTGQYYNNTSFSGSPVFTRTDSAIDFDWGEGSVGGGMPLDNFAIKWDSTQNFATAGNYTINATADDGVRVWADGVLVIDAWKDQGPTTYSYSAYANAGNHTFHVEYYDHTLGARIKIEIVGLGGGGGGGGDVIVDNGAPGWQAGGCYYCWYSSPSGIGGNSIWTFNNTFAVYNYNWARWNVSLPQTRPYEVFAYIPAGLGNTTSAKYWIYHAGFYNYMYRNQGFYPNQWMSLGTYWFSAGGGQFVSLSDVTGECYLCRTIVFDAVKFSPR